MSVHLVESFTDGIWSPVHAQGGGYSEKEAGDLAEAYSRIDPEKQYRVAVYERKD